MISKDAFLLLPMHEQIDLVLEYGSEMIYRHYLYYTIKLFSFNDFLVEIWYLPSKNKIEKVEVLNIAEFYSTYEKSIDISDLFKK